MVEEDAQRAFDQAQRRVRKGEIIALVPGDIANVDETREGPEADVDTLIILLFFIFTACLCVLLWG